MESIAEPPSAHSHTLSRVWYPDSASLEFWGIMPEAQSFFGFLLNAPGFHCQLQTTQPENLPRLVSSLRNECKQYLFALHCSVFTPGPSRRGIQGPRQLRLHP